jgi:hypothetical protein
MPRTSVSTSDSRTGAKVLAQFGVCQNALDPYRPSQWQTAPTPAEILAALPYLAGPYTSIPDVETLKAVIASQYVASIGWLPSNLANRCFVRLPSSGPPI